MWVSNAICGDWGKTWPEYEENKIELMWMGAWSSALIKLAEVPANTLYGSDANSKVAL